MKYGNTKRCRALLMGLAFTLGGGLASAQTIDPVVVSSIDVDLIQVPGQNRLAVKLRVNNSDPVGYGGILNTSFYIRWLTSSGATLGNRTLACADAFGLTQVTPVNHTDGYTYRFYTSNNDGFWADWCDHAYLANGAWMRSA